MQSDSGLPQQLGSRTDAHDELLRKELERRLALLEEADEAEFGAFTRLDWFVTVFFFFLLPLAVAWLWSL